MKIDLHSHTTFSDGQLSPTELVQRAHTMQVDVLAITDHDTTAGLHEAHDAQRQHARQLHIVDGVEISTAWHSFDIHIVGLQVDVNHPVLTAFLSAQASRRNARALKIAEKLERCGFEGVYEKAKANAGIGQITRAHFARVLVSDYGVSSMDTVFKKYLGKGKRAAVKAQWPGIAEAVDIIQQAGGQAVLAHPAHYDMTAKWLRRLVDDFSQAGGDAIECASVAVGKQKQMLIDELALSNNLKVSTGSDFHFPSRWTELGRSATPSPSLTRIWDGWDISAS